MAYCRRMATIARNDPCPCGSGKKYKHCHLGKSLEASGPKFILPVILGCLSVILGVYAGFAKSATLGFALGSGGLILVGVIMILRDPPPPGKGGDPGAINFGS